MTATEVLFFSSISYLAKISFFRLSFCLQKKRLIQLIFIVLTLGKIILQYYLYEEIFAHRNNFYEYKIEAIEQIDRRTPFV